MSEGTRQFGIWLKRTAAPLLYILALASAVGALMMPALQLAARAQTIGSNCVATMQNRSVQVNADGTFSIPNIPVDVSKYRVRVVCTQPDGTTTGGDLRRCC